MTIASLTKTEASRQALWQCGERTFHLSERTLVMGIVNVTPDSFSDGGAFYEPQAAINHGLRLVEEGADLLDVGGESARPGATPVPIEIELRRVLPVVEGLRRRTDVPISIDTSKAKVAAKAIEAGASILNDITALQGDPGMHAVASNTGAAVVLMHMQGTPRSMQLHPKYEDLIDEVTRFLRERHDDAVAAGVAPQRIVLDPGIGFGKTLGHNLELIRRLGDLAAALPRPLLIGPSRKSFIGKVLDLPVEDRLEGSAAVIAASILAGARVVRVHEVRQMVRVARMIDAIMGRASGHLDRFR